VDTSLDTLEIEPQQCPKKFKLNLRLETDTKLLLRNSSGDAHN
jgi:hypothetical protein